MKFDMTPNMEPKMPDPEALRRQHFVDVVYERLTVLVENDPDLRNKLLEAAVQAYDISRQTELPDNA